MQSDRHFTNGITLEVGHPGLGNKASRTALLGFKKGQGIFEDHNLAIRQDLFTPTNTILTILDSLDRPYAATLVADYGRITSDFNKARQLETHLVFGITGPTAFGGQLQNMVHTIIGNDSVNGWDLQISTGLVLDYRVKYKHQLPFSTSLSEVNWVSEAGIGTMSNGLTTGLEFKFGLFRDSYINYNGLFNRAYKHQVDKEDFKDFRKGRLGAIPNRYRTKGGMEYYNRRVNRPLQIYASWQIMSRLTLYDGTIQGSLVSINESTHTLGWHAYDHAQLFSSLQITLDYKFINLTFRKVVENDDVNPKQLFGWGEIDILVLF